MPQLLTQNSKLKKTSKETGFNVYNFGIPAYKSATGKITCPFAHTCIKFCYAQAGAYIWSNVKPAFEFRYAKTLQANFPELIQKEIDSKKKIHAIRVHDSGDYYSPKYLQKWFTIAKNNPDILFYSYTNSVSFFKDIELPANFDVIFSDSGKLTHLIDKTTDRHTKIFKNKKELENAGYIDASKIDLFATRLLNPNNNKIGLIFH